MIKLFKTKVLMVSALLSLLSVFNSMGQGNSWSYKNVPPNYADSFTDITAFHDQIAGISNRAYDLTKSLPANYVKDGSVDYTKYLQDGINANKIVIFPNFPILVNHQGLSLISNSTVIFRKNSQLILQANALPAYQVLRIYDVDKVNLYFPVIKGDKQAHTGGGQWGMGLSICGSTNIVVVNPRISDCWGDGIYIGRLKADIDKNITIYDAELDNNRRNGISIVCADGVKINKGLISNTSGQMPKSGIDVEPNTNADIIKNIKINNVITFNNQMHGIVVSLSGLKGNKPQQVGVDIIGHIDDSSNIGFGLSLNRSDRNIGPLLTGRINVIDPKWINNKKGFQDYKGPANGIDVVFKNLSIKKKTGDGSLSPDSKSISDMKTSLSYDRKIVVQ